MKTQLILATLTLAVALSAFALKPEPPAKQLPVSCPEGFKGQIRTLVHYAPGENAKDFQQFMQPHFAYMQKNMSFGKIIFAGPVIAENGQPEGHGHALYSSGNIAEVKKTVEQDPMISNKVETYTLDAWLQCELAK